MNLAALIIILIWLVFIGIYIAVRIANPDLAKGYSLPKKKPKYDPNGFDKNGWSALGFHRNGTRYDDNGLDINGNTKPEGERTDLKAFEPVPETDFDFEGEDTEHAKEEKHWWEKDEEKKPWWLE